MVKDLRQKLSPGQIAAINLDSVSLSAAEWSNLAPPDFREGSQWVIPKTVGLRLFPLLNPLDRKFGDPGEVTGVQLTGRVVSVRDGIAHLSYAGRIEGTHHGTKSEAKEGQEYSSALKMAGGVSTYDLEAGQMLKLTWVWDGRFSDFSSASDHDRQQPARFVVVAEWCRGEPKAADHLDVNAAGPDKNVELADSTPEEALKTFLIALAAQDESALRTVTLPDAEFDRLLKGPNAAPDVFAQIKVRLDIKSMRRLKAGDRVQMPDGESRVIKPVDVREDRVVLWPIDAPLPSRLENVGGHWKVFARPFIASRKEAADVNRAKVQAESLRNPRGPGR